MQAMQFHIERDALSHPLSPRLQPPAAELEGRA